MTNNLRAKMDRIDTLASVIDAIMEKMQSDTMEFKRVVTTDEDGNETSNYCYVDYDVNEYGVEFCENKKARRRVYEEAIKAIEKLADK